MIVNEYRNVEKDAFFFNTKLNQFKEAILLFGVACVGLFGFCYIIAVSSSTPNFFPNTPQTPGANALAVFAKSCSTEADLNLPCIHSKTSFVSIHGVNSVAAPITFSLLDYNKEAKYIFDFGNGMEKEIEDASFQYTFTQAGNYDLNLKISYQGKTKSIFSKTLTIEPNF